MNWTNSVCSVIRSCLYRLLFQFSLAWDSYLDSLVTRDSLQCLLNVQINSQLHTFIIACLMLTFIHGFTNTHKSSIQLQYMYCICIPRVYVLAYLHTCMYTCLYTLYIDVPQIKADTSVVLLSL